MGKVVYFAKGKWMSSPNWAMVIILNKFQHCLLLLLSMQYYYSSHIRNLENEAFIQKQKISAELHESTLRKDQNDGNPKSGSQSRRKQDRETAAFLERSRLQAELSAVRTKAENSMNRSRIESAFQLRKENQKGFEELSQLSLKHEMLTQRAAQEEIVAHHRFLQSKEEAEERLRYEDRLVQIHREEQLDRAYRNAILNRTPYFPYW